MVSYQLLDFRTDGGCWSHARKQRPKVRKFKLLSIVQEVLLEQRRCQPHMFMYIKHRI